MEFNIHLEFRLPADEAHGDELIAALEQFHPGVGPTHAGRLGVWITVPANNARQAVDLGLALASSATAAELTALEVLPTEDFDSREGMTPMPELISAEEAAEILGVSRQAVSQMHNTNRLPGVRVGDRVLVFARRDVEAAALRRRSG